MARQSIKLPAFVLDQYRAAFDAIEANFVKLYANDLTGRVPVIAPPFVNDSLAASFQSINANFIDLFAGTKTTNRSVVLPEWTGDQIRLAFAAIASNFNELFAQTAQYLLDVLPNATFAGGAIRLKSSYAGAIAKAGATSYGLSGDAIESGSVGASISELLDQGGSAVKFTQATGANQPTVTADGNSVRGLRFGAAGATSYLDSSFSAINQPCTVYILSSAPATQVGRKMASRSTGNYSFLTNGSQWQLYNQNGLMAGAYGGQIGVEKFALVLNGASSRLHVGTNSQTFDTGSISFDDGIRFGTASIAGLQNYDGYIYAIAIYPEAHTPTQVSTAFRALSYPVQLPPLFLADGDSIAYGTGLSTSEGLIHNRIAAKFLADGITISTYNDGSPGQTLAANTEYPGNVLSRCVSTRKCMVMLNQGTNDLSNSSSASTIAALLEAYWAAAKSTGAIVVANTIIARGGGAAHTAPQEAQRLLLNTAIRGSTTPTVICDFGALPEFDEQSDTGNAYYADAVHPSDAGTVLWANAMYPALKTAYDALP